MPKQRITTEEIIHGTVALRALETRIPAAIPKSGPVVRNYSIGAVDGRA